MQIAATATETEQDVLAPVPDLAAVAELMEPAESLVARPDVTLPQGNGLLLLLTLLSPGEPADPEDD